MSMSITLRSLAVGGSSALSTRGGVRVSSASDGDVIICDEVTTDRDDVAGFKKMSAAGCSAASSSSASCAISSSTANDGIENGA